jgi:hypothetical protein
MFVGRELKMLALEKELARFKEPVARDLENHR